MAALHIDDEFGETMRLRILHKNRFISPDFTAEAVEGMSKVALRDDDVLICGYPKSGNHWLWECVRMLVSGKAEYENVDKDSTMMEFFRPGELDNKPSPRLLSNHCFFDDQPSDLLTGKTKVIFVYRNPKDVAVSFFYHISNWPSHEYSGSFHNFLKRLVKGTIPFNSPFDYWKSWEQGLRDNPQISFLPVRYEDLHKDQFSQLNKIAQFLGYAHDEKLLHAIVEATAFKSMRQAKTENDYCMRGKEGDPIMYRKGKIGDWMNHFTLNDNEWFDDVIKTKLAQSNLYQFVYTAE